MRGLSLLHDNHSSILTRSTFVTATAAAASVVPSTAHATTAHIQHPQHPPQCRRGISSAARLAEATNVGAAFEYSEDLVRRYDYDHYLCSLYLPKHLRPVAIAVRAFNVETAQVADQTRQQSLALMRLQWWREAIDSIFKVCIDVLCSDTLIVDVGLV